MLDVCAVNSLCLSRGARFAGCLRPFARFGGVEGRIVEYSIVLVRRPPLQTLCYNSYVQVINSTMQRHTYINIYTYIYLCIHTHLWCNTKLSLQEDHYKQSEQTAADIQQSTPSTQAKRANSRSSLRPLRRKKDGNGDVPAGSCQVAMFSCYVVSMVTLSEHVY